MSTTTSTPPQSTLRRVLLPAIIILLGLAIMCYPVVSSQWNNYVQRDVAARYDESVAQLVRSDPNKVADVLAAARTYNQTHPQGPILDPWLQRIAPDNEQYQEYLHQLNGQPAMSQVIIPAINSKLPVYHGTEDVTLQKGLGHLYGSSLPVGGESTHTVITGHTGITNATLWDNLVKVKPGDAIYLNTLGEKMKYEVDKIDVVLPEDTDSLKVVPGEDRITLITCTPYGINTHRLLVHGHRVPMEPQDEQEMAKVTGFHIQTWMWAVMAATILILACLAAWIWAMAKKNRTDNTEEQESIDA